MPKVMGICVLFLSFYITQDFFFLDNADND